MIVLVGRSVLMMVGCVGAFVRGVCLCEIDVDA